MCWFDTLKYCKMIITIVLANICIISTTMFVWKEHLRSSNFQVYNTIWIIPIIMLHTRSWEHVPLTPGSVSCHHLSLPPTPAASILCSIPMSAAFLLPHLNYITLFVFVILAYCTFCCWNQYYLMISIILHGVMSLFFTYMWSHINVFFSFWWKTTGDGINHSQFHWYDKFLQ